MGTSAQATAAANIDCISDKVVADANIEGQTKVFCADVTIGQNVTISDSNLVATDYTLLNNVELREATTLYLPIIVKE